MKMERRMCKVSVMKAGGNAGKDAKKYSVRLPNKWAREMQINPEERDVVISFDGAKVTIQKAVKETKTP